MELWDRRWRIAEQRKTLLVCRGMTVIAEVTGKSPLARANATVIAQFPELVDCALALIDGADHASVDAADLDRAVALLASLPPVTGKRWHARERSVLATWNRRCVRVARVHDPNMAAAIAGIPDLLEALKYLRDTRQSEPVCHVEATALSAVEQQARLCFGATLKAPHPSRWSSAVRLGPGFAAPRLPAGLAGRSHGQFDGLPVGSNAPAPGARFGPQKAAQDEQELISA
jgi:hypothetical protein